MARRSDRASVDQPTAIRPDADGLITCHIPPSFVQSKLAPDVFMGNDFSSSQRSAGAGDCGGSFGSDLFLFHRRGGQQVLTVYLPGLDILREDPTPTRRSDALLQVRRYLEEEVSRAVAGQQALVILAAESHAAPFSLGRMVVFDGRLTVKTIRICPEDVGPSTLARAGLPVAEDLPGHPVAALFPPGALETTTVPTYGTRMIAAPPRSALTDREYLEKLKSLGYLN